jgi:hypothetical protein
MGNEEHGVGALLFPKALCESTDLFCIGSLPEGSLTALAQLLVLGNTASVRVDSIASEYIGRCL